MPFRIHAIRADDPPDNFPDPTTMGVALGQPDGLLAVGGDLSPQRLVAAYQQGIFPWFNDDQPILWWCPDPRAIIEPRNFHLARRLARDLKRGKWEYSVNHCCAEVIRQCASNRGRFGTWITGEMISAYTEMHELGYVHSVESWHNGELAGGIYGVRLGNKFFGESMFTQVTNGSKVALAGLVHECLAANIDLVDCQMSSEHLESLGMIEISRSDFLQRLQGLDDRPAVLGNGSSETMPAAPLAGLLPSKPT